MARRRKRGRPEGSVRLTPEIERTILSYLEAGAFDYVAAEAAGIHARTYRDWIMRGEDRHPTRSCTPELEAFADKVRQARARSRASREIVVADRDPKFWLQHVARSKPDREGWTEPIERVLAAAAQTGETVLTPKPGQSVEPGAPPPPCSG